MKKRPEIVALVLFTVLLFYAVGLNIFIVPVVQNMMATVDAQLSFLSRVAVTISQYGFVSVMALLLTIAAGLKRSTTGNDDRAGQARVLNLASLVVTVFMVAQGWIFVDMAVSASKIVNRNPRQTASAVVRDESASIRALLGRLY